MDTNKPAKRGRMLFSLWVGTTP